ncbi:hypothetical protein Droror1_Dr00021171 [Drosera rotundifolia]
MANTLSQVVATAIATKSIFATARSSSPNLKISCSSSPSSSVEIKGNAAQRSSVQTSASPLPRRIITWGLVAATLGWSTADDRASSASRRPPPPPPEPKKDPNVSGVLAKVLASKKRKEDMKAAMAKLREKGTPIEQ